MFAELATRQSFPGLAERENTRGLSAHRDQQMVPLLESFGGEVIKHMGDSMLVLFMAATDAVRASLALLRLLHGEGVRMGMTTGDVEVMAGDVFGEVVNLASRIMVKTPIGQVWFSQATLLCMNQTEIPWERVGSFSMKGLPGETELFRAVPEGTSWLPEAILTAIRNGNLIRYIRGAPPPSLPPDSIILLEGFVPGSDELDTAISTLPVVNPASIWLVTYKIAAMDRFRWLRSGRGLVIATSEGFDAALRASRRRLTATSNTDTIIFESVTSIAAELVLAGLALPAVPMAEVVAGYTYDLLPDGRWVHRSDQAIAQVDVTASTVTIRPRVSGLQIDGCQLTPGDAIVLQDGDILTLLYGVLSYRALSQDAYAGLLLADSPARLGLSSGQRVEIGREPRHPGLALPDRRGQDNIRWCPGSRAARARSGGFTMDRALAGRHQASIQIAGERVTVTTLHNRCRTYFVTNQGLVMIDGAQDVPLDALIVAGTSVVSVRAPTS